MGINLNAIDFQQKPNPREKMIFFGVALVCIAGFFRTCYLPSHRALAVVTEQLIHADAEQESWSQRAHLPETVRQQITGNSGSAHDTAALIGSTHDIHNVVKHLSDPVLLGSNQLLASTFSEVETHEGVQRQRVELKLKGTFLTLQRYTESVEARQPPLIIETVALTSNDDTRRRLTLELTGSVYGR